jgi:hypothetical protein
VDALTPHHLMAALGLAGLLAFSGGCTEREAVTGRGPLPVAATAYPNPTGDVVVAKSPPQDIQELSIQVVDGRFDSDRYAAQSRPTRLVVSARGGPYTLSIDGLLQPQQLPVDGTAEIGLTLPDPGDYTMRLGGSASATAVLNVRPVGAR